MKFGIPPSKRMRRAVQEAFPEHFPTEEVLATYTLQLIGAPGVPGTRTTSLTERWLRETEENLTDLLPPGFSVVIRKWDEADESWRSGLWRNTQ